MKLFIVYALFVHLVFLYSIFDVYFTSPLVHGMTPHSSSSSPPAKRIVLFVADGLRADRCFELNEAGEPRTPFLRHIITEVGAWGVSHTRVPTESRPGHVALIGGFYEDVSAVSKGWKDNPVEFDSLFNESTFTWSWGSPDILPMFGKGLARSHVSMTMYPSESEDFAGTSLHELDEWVFDEVNGFFLNQTNEHNEELQKQLDSDSVVFFLHLLGIDTNGHAHNPGSKEYLDNIGLVDEGIKNITQLFHQIYPDDRTAFVFTSDHGMTDWGSHGAGLKDETQTPLIVWGSGVRGPQVSTADIEDDPDSALWGLSEVVRQDVAQADVAALMAALIGTNFPLNSVGVVHPDLLDVPIEAKTSILLANAEQIFAQFKVKMKQKQETTLSMFFRQFPKLSISKGLNKFRQIRHMMAIGQYEPAIKECQKLIKIALKGLHYYHSYDRFFLGCTIVLGFLGWMAYTGLCAVSDHVTYTRPDKLTSTGLMNSTTLLILANGIRVALLGLLYFQNLPFSNYIYCLLPTFLWEEFFKRWPLVKAFMRSDSGLGNGLVGRILMVLSVVCGLEIVVLSFFYRQLLSVGLLSLALWPWLQTLPKVSTRPRMLWSASCCLLSVFPLMPVVGRLSQYYLVLIAGVLFPLLIITVSYYGIFGRNRKLLVFQSLVVFVSSVIVNINAYNIKSNTSNSILINVFSWTIFVTCWLTPLLCSTHLISRLSSALAAFMSLYFLLSISYESLFVFSLCMFLYSWIYLESAIIGSKVSLISFKSSSHENNLGMEDVRRAFIFLFITLLSFFGTGNIASINSFEPASVYCFLTIFNPFVMGGLLLVKIALPFIMVTCAFSSIHACTGVSTQGAFYLILLMCDYCGLHFFFLVKDEGSWLDIGTSISHFVICSFTTIILLMFSRLSEFICTTSLRPLSGKQE